MKCYICSGESFSHKKGTVRDNKNIKVLECDDCGLVFLDDKSHINDKLYEDSEMDQVVLEIDEWINETEWDDQRRFEMIKSMLVNKKVLDFGCGTANFLDKAKKLSKQVSGIELDKRIINYRKGSIDIRPNIDDFSDDSFDVITAFHVIEHLPDPIDILKKFYNKLTDDGTLIIEVPNSQDALITLYDCSQFQDFVYWSRHLYLFSEFTLKTLSKKSGFNVESIKHYQRYPISNHLYWMSKGKPGGHDKWSFMDDSLLNESYANTLASIGKTDTLIAFLKK